MQDFNPLALFAIMYEAMGIWLWILLAVALLLLIGVVSGAIGLRRVAAPWRRPLLAALIGGIAVTALAAWFVPGWSQAAPGSLRGAVDYAVVTAIALVPGLMAAALAFSLASRRCARRSLTRA